MTITQFISILSDKVNKLELNPNKVHIKITPDSFNHYDIEEIYYESELSEDSIGSIILEVNKYLTCY